MIRRDLTIDPYMFNLTLSNFDFGLRLEYVPGAFEPSVAANLNQYIDVRVTQNVYFWTVDQFGTPQFNKTKIRSTMIPCGNHRLGMTPTSPDFLGLKTTYLCP